MNKQVRNYNIKTVIKTVLVVAISWGLLGGALAQLSAMFGLSFPISWSLKEITIRLSVGLPVTVGVLEGINLLEKAINKTMKEFLSKINIELIKVYSRNSNVVNQSLFGYEKAWNKRYAYTPRFESAYHFTADKIKLDPYETVEKRYVEIQEKIREEQSKRWFSSLRSKAS